MQRLPRDPRVLTSTLALLLLCPLALNPSGQATTPAVAFSVTKVPGIERAAITADFNGDGRLDVIAAAVTGAASELVLATGRGDGSVNAPASLGLAGEPLAVFDFNADGRMDVLFRSTNGVSVLPGSGSGTFGTPRLVHASSAGPPLAAPGFFDSTDAIPDLAVVAPDASLTNTIWVYPGNGDFTFDTPLTQPAPNGLMGLRAAQLDADPATDLVALGGDLGTSITMMRNTGAAAFELREFDIHDDFGDIRTADLDGSGTVDIVVSTYSALARHENVPAKVLVLWDGFEATAQDAYDTGVNGESALAIGDFTGDGRLDIATGNWSTYRDDNDGQQLWSSVSVLKGQLTPGTPMTFGAPVTFALGNINREGYTESWSLEAADMNEDGRLDLVHAPGAILLNEIPQPNQAPTAFAGTDRTYAREDVPLVRGAGFDPDGHWLEYRWSNGKVAPWFSFGGINGAEPGIYDVTLTVDDGQGASDSDSVTITVADTFTPTVGLLTPTFFEDTVATGSPYRIEWGASDANGAIAFIHLSYSTDGGRTFSPITECLNLPGSARSCVWQNPGPASDYAQLRIEALYGASQSWIDVSQDFRLAPPGTFLPPQWLSHDVGSVAAAGSATESNGTFTVNGSGADVWGTTDEFHYASRVMRGDFDLIARVASVENVHPWTKAGLMIRSGSGLAGAPHAFLFATPSGARGISLQYRPEDNASTVEPARVAAAPPVWLKLMRRGTQVTGAWRHTPSEQWRPLPAVTVALEQTVLAGLAVTSHQDGTIATATFDNVLITSPGDEWQDTDIGAVGAPGDSTFNDGTFTVNGSGADIWGTADEFHYVHQAVNGDFQIIAHIGYVEPEDRWTKAGLMMREGTGADARHAFVFATPTADNGVAFQRRTSRGGTSVHTAGPAQGPPVWLRLIRTGNLVTASYRLGARDGWTTIGSQTFSALAGTVQVGMAVTSHRDGEVARAVFDDVALENGHEDDQFQSRDIGPVGIAGTTSVGTGGLTIDGSGADIWGTADAFRYYYRQWTGDGSITVRVVNIENTNPWAKAGVMFRETLAANSKHVMAIVSPGRGVAAQYRGSTGGSSANVTLASGTAPEWLRLTRSGHTFTAAASNDGTTWRALGSISIPMSAALFVGLPVTSHDNSTLATAIFDMPVVSP